MPAPGTAVSVPQVTANPVLVPYIVRHQFYLRRDKFANVG